MKHNTVISTEMFEEILNVAILDNAKLTPTALQRVYFPQISKQAVHGHIKRLLKKKPHTYRAYFMSNRDQAYAMFEKGMTVKEVTEELKLTLKMGYNYYNELREAMRG